MVLELLNDDVERGREKPQREPAANERDCYGGYRGKNRTEHGDYLEERGDNSKEKRVLDAENGQAEIHECSNNDGEKKLALHPEADFPPRAFPQIKHVLLIAQRRNDPKKIVDACPQNGKVERENDDEEEREHTAEYVRDGAESVAIEPGRSQVSAHTFHQDVGGNNGSSLRPEEARILVVRHPLIERFKVGGKRCDERRQVAEKRRDKEEEYPEKSAEKKNVDEEHSENAGHFPASERLDGGFYRRSDDNSRQKNENDILKRIEKPRSREDEHCLEYRAGRYRNAEIPTFHGLIVA